MSFARLLPPKPSVRRDISQTQRIIIERGCLGPLCRHLSPFNRRTNKSENRSDGWMEAKFATLSLLCRFIPLTRYPLLHRRVVAELFLAPRNAPECMQNERKLFLKWLRAERTKEGRALDCHKKGTHAVHVTSIPFPPFLILPHPPPRSLMLPMYSRS